MKKPHAVKDLDLLPGDIFTRFGLTAYINPHNYRSETAEAAKRAIED